MSGSANNGSGRGDGTEEEVELDGQTIKSGPELLSSGSDDE